MEASVMQSCSRSSLGRWSMELLRGSMERGFFFFSRSGDKAAAEDKQIRTAGVVLSWGTNLFFLCSWGLWRVFFASQMWP